MKTKVMETSITSETVSQDIISGEMEGPSKDSKVSEVGKKAPRVPNKDKEHNNDQGSNREGETEIEQRGQIQKKQEMTRMKRTAKKRTIREDSKPAEKGKEQERKNAHCYQRQ